MTAPYRFDRLVAESTLRPPYHRRKWHPAWNSFEMVCLYLIGAFLAGLGIGSLIWR